MKNYLPLLIILIPLIIVTLPTFFINMKNYGKTIPFRPPPIVFSIVWPILLLLLGLSWYLYFINKSTSINNLYIIHILFILIILLLALWSIIYKYSKIGGLINIIIGFCILLYLIINLFKNTFIMSAILLIPLIGWLIFAGILNGMALKLT